MKIYVPMAPWAELGALRYFFFGKLDGDLLLLTFAQDCERHICSFCKTAHKLCQLVRLGKDLIVQHLKNVILLNARGSSRSIRDNVVNNESKSFG